MEKQRILTEHNRVRQEVARGKVAGQPPATNMREMVSAVINNACNK